MKLELFVNFEGNCREAVEFYAKVFGLEVQNLMTYGETPADPNYPINEADTNKVCYAGLQFGNMVMMFMDMPTGSPLLAGNNINPTVSLEKKEEVDRVFNALKEGGEVYMQPQKTFFSEHYGLLKDKFGIVWHLLMYEGC